jgi:predicted dehydrogenase
MLRIQNFKIQRIGIIGTGRIAGRMLMETKSVSGVSVQGTYNPNLESAKNFADKYEINMFDTLEELYDHTEIVYVATPHETHYGYVKDALLHGKHVLCEKPFVLDKSQAEELFGIAKSNNRILFEGIKTAYCPGFTKLIDIACSGLIGCVKYVDACFTKLEDENTRELTDTKYGGSFLELGSYCMLPMIKLLGINYEDVTFDSIYNSKHIDIFTKASFKYHKGLATLTCGLGVKSEGRLLIAGTKGYITVEAPWWKTTYFEVHFEDESKVEKYSERFLGDGLRYEISDLLNQIKGNEKSEFKLTRDESITMADIMYKFMKHEGRT